MLKPTLSLNEMRQKVYELRRKVGAGIEEVREYSRTSSSTIPQDAVMRYREFEKRTTSRTGGTPIRYMNEKQLREAYRDLEYISHLKTSTLEGAREAAITFGPVKQFVDTLSQDMRDKFWQLFERLVTNEELRSRFKYDIMDITETLISSGYGNKLESQDFIGDITDRMNRLYEQYSLNLSEARRRITSMNGELPKEKIEELMEQERVMEGFQFKEDLYLEFMPW